MTKKMKKKMEVFKLEERVLFDAAAAADIVEAMQNDPAIQSQQSEQDHQAEEAKNAVKNAAPESPADAAQQGAQAEEQAKAAEQPTSTEVTPSADADAAAQALVEGAIPAHEVVEVQQTTDAPDADDAQAMDGEADTAELTGEAQDVDTDVQAAESADPNADATDDSGEAQAATSDADDANADATDGNGEAAFVEAFDAGGESEAGRELVIINSSIRDKEAFIEEAGEDADVLVLSGSGDALDEINEFLDAHDAVKYDSVHFISHGDQGYILLNGQVIDAEAVANDPAAWAAIGEHLTADADIILYGCNVAGSLDGQALVAQIADLTGADVGASTTTVGAGSWAIDYVAGHLDNSYLAPADYEYSLATKSYTIGLGGYGSFEAAWNAYATSTQKNDDDVVFAWTMDESLATGTFTMSTTPASYTFNIGSQNVNFANTEFTTANTSGKSLSISVGSGQFRLGTIHLNNSYNLNLTSSGTMEIGTITLVDAANNGSVTVTATGATAVHIATFDAPKITTMGAGTVSLDNLTALQRANFNAAWNTVGNLNTTDTLVELSGSGQLTIDTLTVNSTTVLLNRNLEVTTLNVTAVGSTEFQDFTVTAQHLIATADVTGITMKAGSAISKSMTVEGTTGSLDFSGGDLTITEGLTTSRDVTFDGSLTLGGLTTTGDVELDTGAKAIAFSNNADVSLGGNLTLTTTGGVTVGNLHSLTATAASEVTGYNGSWTVGDMTLNANLTLPGAVTANTLTLDGGTTLTAGGVTVTKGLTTNGAAGITASVNKSIVISNVTNVSQGADVSLGGTLTLTTSGTGSVTIGSLKSLTTTAASTVTGYNGSWTVGAMTLGADLTLPGGNVTISGSLATTVAATLNTNGGTVAISDDADLTLAGNLTLTTGGVTVGKLGDVTVTSVSTVTGYTGGWNVAGLTLGAHLTLTGALQADAVTVTSASTLTGTSSLNIGDLTLGANLTLAGWTSLASLDTLTMNGNATLAGVPVATLTIGTLTGTGTLSTSVNVLLNGVTSQSGNALGVSTTGDVAVSGDGLTLNAPFSITGANVNFANRTVTLNANSSLTVSVTPTNMGKVTAANGSSQLNLGTRDIDYVVEVKSGATLTIQNARSMTAAVTVAGTLNITSTGADVSAGNAMTVENGGSLQWTDYGYSVNLSGATFENGATVKVNAGGVDLGDLFNGTYQTGTDPNVTTTFDFSNAGTITAAGLDKKLEASGAGDLNLKLNASLKDIDSVVLHGSTKVTLDVTGAGTVGTVTLYDTSVLNLIANSAKYDLRNIDTGNSGQTLEMDLRNIGYLTLEQNTISTLAGGNGTLNVKFSDVYYNDNLTISVGAGTTLAVQGANVNYSNVTVDGTFTAPQDIDISNWKFGANANLNNTANVTADRTDDLVLPVGSYNNLSLKGTADYTLAAGTAVSGTVTLAGYAGTLTINGMTGDNARIDAANADAAQTVVYDGGYNGNIKQGTYQNLTIGTLTGNATSVRAGQIVNVKGLFTNTGAAGNTLSIAGTLTTHNMVDETPNVRQAYTVSGIWNLDQPTQDIAVNGNISIENGGKVNVLPNGHKVDFTGETTVVAGGALTVNAVQKNADAEMVTFEEVLNSGTVTFSSAARINSMLLNKGWTNSGTFSVTGFDYFGFDGSQDLYINNYGKIYLENASYVLGVNGGDPGMAHYIHLKTNIQSGYTVLHKGTGSLDLYFTENASIYQSDWEKTGYDIPQYHGGIYVSTNTITLTKDDPYRFFENTKIEGSIVVDGTAGAVDAVLTLVNVTVEGSVKVGANGTFTYDCDTGKWTNFYNKTTLTIVGDRVTFKGDVTDAAGDSSATVIFTNIPDTGNKRTGDAVKLVKNWYSVGDYTYADNDYYMTDASPFTVPDAYFYTFTQDKLTLEAFQGTINVVGVKYDSDSQAFDGSQAGTITFNGDVVVAHEFNIKSGEIKFANGVDAIVAVAGGNFTIQQESFDATVVYRDANGAFQTTQITVNTDTTVGFGGYVYVSATYNATRDTNFTVKGGEVVFNKDVQNWVRTWRGYYGTNSAYQNSNIAEGAIYSAVGDFIVYTTTPPGATKQHDYPILWSTGDGTIYHHGESLIQSLQFYNSTYGHPTTTVTFEGGKVTFSPDATMRNYSVFGEATVDVKVESTVSFSDVRNITYDGYTPELSATSYADLHQWDAGWVTEYALATAKDYRPTTVFPSSFKPGMLNAVPDHQALIKLDTNVTVSGDIENGASKITITGSKVEVLGTITHEALSMGGGGVRSSSLRIDGGGHSFYKTVATGASSIYVTGTHTLGEISLASTVFSTTSQRPLPTTLMLDTTGASTLSLICKAGGLAQVNGNNTGFQFRGIELSGTDTNRGALIIDSEFGQTGIETEITIGQGASLEIQKENILKSTVTNRGTLLVSAANSRIGGKITNYGTFTVDEYAVFDGQVINMDGGGFTLSAPGMLLDGTLDNSGNLKIDKPTTFRNMINRSTGKITFATGATGAEGTIFVNLTNEGDITVGTNSVFFSGGLTNSGTITIPVNVTGVRFADMVDKDGNITFINSGTLNFFEASPTNVFIDIDNRGTVYSEAAHLYFGMVRNSGTIEVRGNNGEIAFYGDLVNSGTIRGIGKVFIYGTATGDGEFSLDGPRSLAEYQFTKDSIETGAVIDSDGYLRIDGHIYGDAYSNRPIYNNTLQRWELYNDDGTKTGGYIEASRFATVSTRGGFWQVGIETGNKVGTVKALDGSGEHWTVDGIDTGYRTSGIAQRVYGGSVANINLSGDGVLTLGDGIADSTLTVTDQLLLDTKLRIAKNATLSFAGSSWTDTGAEWVVLSGGTLAFDMASSTSAITVNGATANSGRITVMDDRDVRFSGKTSGIGTIAASGALVTYQNTADADQTVYGGTYQKLSLSGAGKQLDGDATMSILENGVALSVANGTLTVNSKASGAGAISLGDEAMLVLKNPAITPYEYAGDIAIGEEAYGLTVDGGSAGITFSGKVTNLSSEDPYTAAVGILADGKVTFADLTNTGTVRLNGADITLTKLTMNDGTLFFNVGEGNTFTFDGTDQLVGNGGTIDVLSGTLTVSALGATNQTAFTVRNGAEFILTAAGSALPQVTVDDGGTFTVDLGAGNSSSVGAADPAQGSGLKLNGSFVLRSGDFTVYGYATDVASDESTASIMIEDGNLILANGAATYGMVYTHGNVIELVNGTLTANDRFAGQLNEWLLIVNDTFTTAYGAGIAGKSLLIQNGATLTVDGLDDGSEVLAALALGNIRIEDGNLLVENSGGRHLALAITIASLAAQAGTSVTVSETGNTLTVTGETAVDTVTVTNEGTLNFTGGVVISDADPAVQKSVIHAGNQGTVSYGGGTVLLSGEYYDLNLDGADVKVGDISVKNSISGANGAAITFDGATDGTATVSGDLSATYTAANAAAAKHVVYLGEYQTLEFIGDHTVNGSGDPADTITVSQKLSITSASGTDTVLLTLNNANLTVNDGVVLSGTDLATIVARKDSVVTYDSGNARTIFSGNYRTLTVTGSGAQTINMLGLDTELNGSGYLVVGGANGGGSVDGTNVTYQDTVAAGFFGGTYGNLTIKGSGEITKDIKVAGTASLYGALTGSGKLTFSGKVLGSDVGTIGTAASAYTGLVVYDSALGGSAPQNIFGGNIESAVMTGDAKSLRGNLTVGTLELGSNLDVSSRARMAIGAVTVSSGMTPTISVQNNAELTLTMTDGVDQPAITNNGTLNLGGTYTFNGDAMKNFGMLTVVAGGDITLVAPTVSSSSVFRTNAPDARLVLRDLGSAAAPVLMTRLVSNGESEDNGGIYLDNSFVRLTGSTPFSGTGYISIENGSSLLANGSGTFEGTLAVAEGTLLTVEGDLVLKDLWTLGNINVGADAASEATLTLYTVYSGDPDLDSSHMSVVGTNAQLIFEPLNNYQMIYGYVSGEPEASGGRPRQVFYDPSHTGFYHSLTSYWITVDNTYTKGFLGGSHGYRITSMGTLSVGGNFTETGSGTQFEIAPGGKLVFEAANSELIVNSKIVNNGVTEGQDGIISYRDLRITTDPADLGGSGVISASGRTVTYAATTDGTVYNGTYGTLKLEGAFDEDGNFVSGVWTLNDVKVETALISVDPGIPSVTAPGVRLNGTISGSADVTFNGATSGTGTFDMTGGKVTYLAGQTVFGGTYNDLDITGVEDVVTTINNNIVVNGAANFNPTALSPIPVVGGTGNMTFNGSYSGGLIQKTAGTVAYGENFNGTLDAGNVYYDLVIDTTNEMELTGVTVINTFGGTGKIRFTGSVGGSATAAMEAGSIVTYDGNGITPFAGTYDSLVFENSIGAALSAQATITGAITAGTVTMDDTMLRLVVDGSSASLTMSDLQGNSSDQYLYIWDGGTATFAGQGAAYVITPYVRNEAGTLNLQNGLYQMDVRNLNRSTMSLSGAGMYVSDDGSHLENGGKVELKDGSQMVIAGNFTELNGNKLFSVTNSQLGIALNAPITSGIAADFSTGAKGAIVLATGGQMYSGKVTLDGKESALDVYSQSTFTGEVHAQYGSMFIDANAAGTTFSNTVYSGSRFYIEGDTTFGNYVSVVHGMEIGDGTNAVSVSFNGDVVILASDGGSFTFGNYTFTAGANTGDTEMLIHKNATVSFQNDVYVSNKSDTGSWMSGLQVDGKASFGAALSIESAKSGKQAEARFDGDGSSFNGTVTLTGASAIAYVNGSGIVFNDAVTNGGVFNLNNNARFNSTFTNSRTLNITEDADEAFFTSLVNNGTNAVTSITGDSVSVTLAQVTNTRGTFNVNARDVYFRGDVTNTAGTFNVNAASSFNGAVTNAGREYTTTDNSGNVTATTIVKGMFLVNGKSTFSSVANKANGEFRIMAGGNDTVFNGVVENAGTVSVMQNVAGVVFNKDLSIAENGMLILGGVDTVFNGAVDNSGTIRVTGGRDSDDSTPGNEIKGTLSMNSGSLLAVGSEGELTLNKVSDVWQGTVPERVYYLETTVTTTTTNETTGVSTTSVTTSRHALTAAEKAEYLAGTYVLPTSTVSDSSSTLYKVVYDTVYVDGTQPKMTVADQGILRFRKLDFVQTIHSQVRVDGDGDVQYEYGWTIFEDIDYADWLMISDSLTVSGYGKYRIVDGGSVTVSGSAYDSHFRVNQGGVLTLNTATEIASLINRGGTVNINGGTYAIDVANDAGTMNVTDAQFDGTVTNREDLNVKGEVTMTQLDNIDGNVTVDGTAHITGMTDTQNASLTVNGTADFGSATAVDGALTVNGGTVEGSPVTLNGETSGSNATFNSDVNYAGSDQTIIAGQYNGALNVTGSGAKVGGSVTVADGQTLTVADGQTLTVEQGATLGVSQTAGDGAVANKGTVNVTGNNADVTLDLNAGTANVTGDNANVTLVSNTGTANVGGDGASLTVTGDNSGTANVTGTGASVSVDGNNSGTADVSGANASITVTGDNAGTIKASGDNATVQAGTNSGTVNLTGDAAALSVTGDNSGTVAASGDSASVQAGTNSGTISTNGTNTAIDTVNNGTVTVAGTGASLTGTNNGQVTVAKGADLALTGTDTANASYDIAGTMTVDMTDQTVHGAVDNDGEVVLAGQTTFEKPVDNTDGSVTVTAAAAGSNLAQVSGGAITLNGQAEFGDGWTNEGTLTANVAEQDFSNIVNNGTVVYGVDKTLTSEIAGSGTVWAGEGSELTLAVTGDVEGNYGAQEGATLAATGDTNFKGDVTVEGTLDANGNDLAFSGETSGNGTIADVGANVVYGAEAGTVFGADYQSLTVTGDSELTGDASVSDMQLDGSLATAAGTTLTFTGATAGSGTMAGGQGSVVYDAGADPTIYNGTYNNVEFRNAATQTGDATISGNAAVAAGGSFTATDGTVTYNGASEQTVATGTYDNLTLTGSGAKVFEAGSESTVTGTLNVQGSQSALTTMKSSDAAGYTLNAGNANIHYAYIDGMKSSTPLELDGTNRLGPHTSGIETFNAASGIGDMFPDMNNRNLNAVSFTLASELMNAEQYESQLLEEFRRSRMEQTETPENTVNDLSFEDEERFFADAEASLEDIIDMMAEGDIDAQSSDVETGDVVAAGGVFQTDLDEALEKIIKA